MSFPRYEKYKDSGVEWLGEVPGHWDSIQFKRLASIQNGRDYKHIETEGDAGYPVIGSGGEFARATECLFTGESVLLGRKGTIDKPLYINGSFWAVDTMFYTLVNKKAVPKYLYYCVLTIRFDFFSTSTAVPSMTQNDLGKIYFAVPDLAEQADITAFLDRETSKIDALIAEQQRLIELLKEKRQAVISRAVTKGLNPSAPMKDSSIEWLGQVPEHWEVTPLKYIASLKGRLGWQGLRAEEYTEDGPFLVTSEHFVSDRIDWSRCYHVLPERYAIAPEIQLRADDLLMMKDGAAMGKLAYVDSLPGLACLNSHLLLFRPMNGRFFNKFLYYVLGDAGFKCYMFQERTGTTFFGISQESIGNFPLAVPPVDEQCQIIEFLTSKVAYFDALTVEAQTAIDLLRERRSVLISAAVTGKIDVRGLAMAQSKMENAA